MAVISQTGEQMTGCTVFNSKTVTKYLSLSEFCCSNVQYLERQTERASGTVKILCIPVHNNIYSYIMIFCGCFST